MSASRIFDRTRRLNKTQKLSVAGVSALGVAALTFSLVPSNAQAESTNASLAASPVVFASGADSARAKAVQDSVIEQNTTAAKLVKAADAAKAKDEAARKKAVADAKALTDAKAAERAAAEAKVKAADRAKADAAKRSSGETASRSAERKPVYANNLNGWIQESLAIMKEKGIPGTYEGLHRNIIRESSGNPQAINDWDINAQNGVPSIGLLQIIKPTFDYYHVAGTVHSQYDPVANITAAANYAADKYGSIDNVDSAY
ncbi:transglycosylase SLT domain-containing protein [Streptomyces sp. NBC_00102]|uniref:transglycosylase SLT domain-containing protein n=1 Tax=Streptomyces sp. NBC_00102 TaxID=2975652 RepID=UPI002259BF03|nr:transglycosylase SLT domain-containing protein [Streptomyces sp. NBC_00102]MCX5396201.1 transglycosylase SLT domain-containing protein [Streptomyces sp. NBC_00102]